MNISESEDSVRIDLRPKMWQSAPISGLLWLGFFLGVRLVGSGDFGRFVVFLALWGASAACRVAI